jgi:hypothetical protein
MSGLGDGGRRRGVVALGVKECLRENGAGRLLRGEECEAGRDAAAVNSNTGWAGGQRGEGRRQASGARLEPER